MLPAQQLASLLEDHFFPKWHAVLQHWLAHAPDYDEVTAWYLGWKVQAPPSCFLPVRDIILLQIQGACGIRSCYSSTAVGSV